MTGQDPHPAGTGEDADKQVGPVQYTEHSGCVVLYNSTGYTFDFVEVAHYNGSGDGYQETQLWQGVGEGAQESKFYFTYTSGFLSPGDSWCVTFAVNGGRYTTGSFGCTFDSSDNYQTGYVYINGLYAVEVAPPVSANANPNAYQEPS